MRTKVNPRRQANSRKSAHDASWLRENAVWLDYKAKHPEVETLSEDKQMGEARAAAELGRVWVQVQDCRCFEILPPFPVDRIAPNFSSNTKILAHCDRCDSQSIRGQGEAWVLTYPYSGRIRGDGTGPR